MQTYRKLFLILFILYLSIPQIAQATGSKPSITGIYSNMDFNEEGGDVLGIEVFLVYTSKGYYVVFQSSAGEPTVPIVVRAKINKSKIEFSLPQSSKNYSGRFLGKITPSEIKGSFELEQIGPHGEKEIILKRKKSYWQ
jgi:hypothetical protein